MTDPRRSDRRAEAGLTLLELLFVLVVIGIGLLALSGVQTRTSTDVYSTGRETQALALAQARMEAVRAGTFAAARSDSGQVDGYNWRTLVSSPTTDLKRIEVAVSWREYAQTRVINLDNLMSDR